MMASMTSGGKSGGGGQAGSENDILSSNASVSKFGGLVGGVSNAIQKGRASLVRGDSLREAAATAGKGFVAGAAKGTFTGFAAQRMLKTMGQRKTNLDQQAAEVQAARDKQAMDAANARTKAEAGAEARYQKDLSAAEMKAEKAENQRQQNIDKAIANEDRQANSLNRQLQREGDLDFSSKKAFSKSDLAVRGYAEAIGEDSITAAREKLAQSYGYGSMSMDQTKSGSVVLDDQAGKMGLEMRSGINRNGVKENYVGGNKMGVVGFAAQNGLRSDLTDAEQNVMRSTFDHMSNAQAYSFLRNKNTQADGALSETGTYNMQSAIQKAYANSVSDIGLTADGQNSYKWENMHVANGEDGKGKIISFDYTNPNNSADTHSRTILDGASYQALTDEGKARFTAVEETIGGQSFTRYTSDMNYEETMSYMKPAAQEQVVKDRVPNMTYFMNRQADGLTNRGAFEQLSEIGSYDYLHSGNAELHDTTDRSIINDNRIAVEKAHSAGISDISSENITWTGMSIESGVNGTGSAITIEYSDPNSFSGSGSRIILDSTAYQSLGDSERAEFRQVFENVGGQNIVSYVSDMASSEFKEIWKAQEHAARRFGDDVFFYGVEEKEYALSGNDLPGKKGNVSKFFDAVENTERSAMKEAPWAFNGDLGNSTSKEARKGANRAGKGNTWWPWNRG